jgi:hypothetical protein
MRYNQPSELLAAVALCCGLLTASSISSAAQQPGSPQNPADSPAERVQPAKPSLTRRPLIDLKAMAKERRPGQVLPGDPAPVPGTNLDRAGSTMVSSMNVSGAAEALTDLRSMPPPVRRVWGTLAGEPGTVTVSEEPLPSVPLASGAIPSEPAVPTLVSTVTSRSEPGTFSASMSPSTEGVTSTAAIATIDPAQPSVAQPASIPSVPLVSTPAPAQTVTTPPEPAAVVNMVGDAGTPQSAKVRIERIDGNPTAAEWRAGDQPWGAVTVGAVAEGRVDVRGGLDAELVLSADDRTRIVVNRLARVSIQSSVEIGAAPSTFLVLSRGLVRVQSGVNPGEAWTVRVRTPDRSFALTSPAEVEYDAFGGTRIRLIPTGAGSASQPAR